MRFCTLSMTLLATLLTICSCTIASPANKSKTAPLVISETRPNAKNVEVAALSIHEDDMTPSLDGSTTHHYQCELNDSLTIYTNQDDDAHAALRWKKRLYRLNRVQTTTGAERFENKKAGLVWIGIPTKGMLMDSIRGEQLTNECKTAGQ